MTPAILALVFAVGTLAAVVRERHLLRAAEASGEPLDLAAWASASGQVAGLLAATAVCALAAMVAP